MKAPGLLGSRALAQGHEMARVLTFLTVGNAGLDSGTVAHKVGLIDELGTQERYPNLDWPNQVGWQLGPEFGDGRRVIASSYEDATVSKIRAGQVRTHAWIYDLVTGDLREILQQDRASNYMHAGPILPGGKRVIVSAIIEGEQRLFIMNLDGGNQVELSHAGEGFHYGLSLNSNGTRLALHVTGGRPAAHNRGPYCINVLDLTTGERVLVAAKPHNFYFGPRWSPDEQWLAYLGCMTTESPPNHFRSDLCIGRPDGSEKRRVTEGQPHWWGTPYGSNTTEWSPDGGTVTFTRLLPRSARNSHPVDGGAQVCLLNPFTGDVTELTTAEEGKWDFRPAWSPDAERLAFVRLARDGVRELWCMDSDGGNQRLLTRGYKDRGADHARWLKIVR